MKIVDIRWTPVFVRFHRPELWVWSGRGGMTSMIVEVETDEGLVGLGECAAWPSVRLTEVALQSIRQYALGEDPLEPEPLWQRVLVLGGWRHAAPAGNTALSAFETALWDIVGKAAGQPLYRLFGGAVRDRVEYFWYLMRGEVDEVAQEAKAAADAGFRTLYVKLGIGLEQDLELVHSIRAAAPAAALRIDPNEGWSYGRARTMLDGLAAAGVELLEQPTLAWSYDELARLRSNGVAILANESSWQERDVVECLRRQAADVISLDHQMLGGLSLLRKMANMCESWGYPVLKHSFGELGIATAAGLHAIACCRNFLYANQSYCSVVQEDVLASPDLVCRNGFLELPTGPGLGVELDRDALGRLADAFVREEAGSSWYALAPGDVPAVPRY